MGILKGYERPTYLSHPLAINGFVHWLRLLRTCGGVDAKHLVHAACITAASPLTAHVRLCERLVYALRRRSVAITKPPVFIIGHWRTGTTHLHNLMSQDPALGFVSTFQAMAPTSFLVGRPVLRPIMAFFLPSVRPVDDMPMSVDLPQEEEFALCNACPHSYYVGLYFPTRARALFQKCALLEGISDKALAQWRKAYIDVVTKATLHARGKRLVLKNPVNTARTAAIRTVFPGAKFIHIYRNPYEVFGSSIRLGQAFREWMALQAISDAEIEANVLALYRDMMMRFFEQKGSIPKGDLVEVRFEDLDARPMDELARIYETLGLPGWSEAREPIEQCLAAHAQYRKHPFSMSAREIAKVEAHWQFAIDALGYERPGPQSERSMMS